MGQITRRSTKGTKQIHIQEKIQQTDKEPFNFLKDKIDKSKGDFCKL